MSRRDSSAEGCIHVAGCDADWELAAGVEDFVDSAAGPDWFRLGAEPRAQCLKRGDARCVYRVPLGARFVIVKCYEAPRKLPRLRQSLGLLPAQREFGRAYEAWRAGVPTPRPLGCGWLHREPVSVFLAEDVADGQSLAHAWDAGRHPAARIARPGLTSAMAEALATAHAAGIVHRDLHPRNVLVQVRDGTETRVLILDWSGARRCRRASLRQCVGNLAQLDQYFHRVAWRGQRLRFLRSYLDARKARGLPPPHWEDRRRVLACFSEGVARHRRGLARTRDRRLRGDGRYFARFVLDDAWRAVVMLRDGRRHVLRHRVTGEWTEQAWQNVLRPMLDAAAFGSAAPVSTSLADGQEAVVQAACARGWLERCAWALAGSPARRRLIDSHHRRHRDQDVAPVVAALEHRRMGLVDRCLWIEACGPSPQAPVGVGMEESGVGIEES